MTDLYIFFPFLGLVGLFFAGLTYLSIKKIEVKNPLMLEISDAIHDGAMVFLKREYSILVAFITLIFILLSWKISLWTGTAFVLGALSSMLAGFFGLKAATRANVRTAQSANQSGMAQALNVAVSGVAVALLLPLICANAPTPKTREYLELRYGGMG